MTGNGVRAMWFLPSALNVQVKRFNQARVNSESNYDSEGSQMLWHLVSDMHEWINEIPTVPVYYLAKLQPKEMGLVKKEDPVELDSSLTLWKDIRGVE